MKKKICFAAQFPPPLHGLTKAVDTLYRSSLQDTFTLEKLDITDNRKIFHTLRRIRCSDADLFYFTISQSRGGNLRDLQLLKAMFRTGKKVVVHLHGGYYRTLVDECLPAWQKKANYTAMAQVDAAIVLADSLRYIFEGMTPPEKIISVGNCVDEEFRLTEAELEEKFARQSREQVRSVLYLSNFISSKGYPQLLECAYLEKLRRERGEFPCYRFDFAGAFFDPKEKEFFFRYLREHQLEEIVTYHGVVDGEKKRELLKKGDVFALPTSYPKEGQPISIIEAMSSGMAVLSTPHAGIPDLVTDMENGALVPVGACAEVIYRRLMSFSKSRIESMGRESRKKADEQFTCRQYVENMTHCFEIVLSQPQKGA